MKQIYFLLAVLATALLVSCEREKSFGDLTPLGENEIGFVMQGVSTRSTDVIPNAVKGVSIPVGATNDGESLFLEETIEELNPTLATRGTPAYTVNVGMLYKTMGVYAEEGNFGGDATYERMDGDNMYPRKDEDDGEGWRFHHNYNGRPWPDGDDEKVNFFLRMPATDYSIKDGTLDYDITGKSIAFDYVSQLTATDQKDILFGYTQLSKNDHDDFLPNGAPVNMLHALTGVKFRTGNDNTGSTKTIITKVEFTGLAASGHCVITPSSSSNSVVWSNWGTKDVVFSQDFSNPDYSRTSDNTITYEKSEDAEYKFGDSWYSAAAGENLNDEEGTMTFWFIPQTITEGVTLKVTFCVKTPDTAGADGGGVVTHTIDFGKALNNVQWKAGQLRTFTLVPKEVDVEIFDKMSDNVKEELHVTNTGNVHEYVRMTFLGNWYDKDGNIVVGYKYSGPDDPELPEGADPDEMVLPWYGAGYEGADPEHPTVVADPYGHFDPTFELGVLPSGSKWVRASGGYYYTEAIGPGVKMDPDTQALFQSYTLTDTPPIYVPSTTSDTRVLAQGVHLVMEVAIQAIYAPMNEDGTEASNWKQEWYNATKNPKLKPSSN